MIPNTASKYTTNAMKEKGIIKKGQPIAITQETTILPTDKCTLRIVSVHTHKQNKLYALVDHRNNISGARRVPIENVFYFSISRDDTIAARENRAEAWSSKITASKVHRSLGKVAKQQAMTF